MADEVVEQEHDGGIESTAAMIDKLFSTPEGDAPAASGDDDGDDIEAIAAELEKPAETATSEPVVAAQPAAETKVEPAKVDTTAPAATAPKPAPAPTEASAAQAQIESTLNFAKALTGQLQQQLFGEFADVKSDADVERMMETDPARYNRFAIAVNKMQRASGQVAQLEQQAKDAQKKVDEEREAESATTRLATARKIAELIPDLADPEKGRKLGNEMTAYAAKMEIPSSRYKDATAGEVSVLRKAMLYDAAEAANAAALEAANKKAAKAPPVQQPGTVQNRSSAKDEKTKEKFDRFSESGRIDDLARLLEATL